MARRLLVLKVASGAPFADLTPAEADSMQESARGVFKEKLNILRSQFSACVQAAPVPGSAGPTASVRRRS